MYDLTVGIVGLGPRGRAMLKLAALFDGIRIGAACDIKPENWYQQKWRSDAPLAELFPDTKFYEDYDRMLDEAGLDAVIVETGADIHAAFCIKALEKNIHVLTDIPCIASLEEAEALWQAHQTSKASICTGANPNYQKFAVLLQEFYQKGLLGKPYCMEAEYIHWMLPGSSEHIHWNENGNWRKLLIPIHYCTHSLGPLLTVLQEELRTVSCFGSGQHAPREEYANPNKDDMMCAQFQTASGVIVRLMRNGRCRAEIGHHNYRVFGTEGYMERIDRFGKPVIRYNSTKEADTGLKEIGGEFMPPEYADTAAAKNGHGGIDYAMMDNFFKHLCHQGGHPVTLKEGLAMSIPGLYAAESAMLGGKVLKIRYPWDADWTTAVE